MAKNLSAKKELNSRKGKGRRWSSRQSGRRLGFECLETRAMLAAIVWENRADFELGANTAAARAVIDQVLLDWGAVISSFNYRNVGQSGWSDSSNYTLTIDVEDLTDYKGGGVLAYCSPDDFDEDGKPFEGSMVIGSNVNWWFDTTPADDSEFNASNPAIGGSPVKLYAGVGNLAGMTDLYSTVLHELGHGLGFSSDTDAAWHRRINSNDYFVFNDGSTAKLERSDANPGSPPAHTGTTEFLDDLMNPALPGNMRRTISALDARILGEGYGYTINERQVDRRSFITTLDSTNRALTAWGDLGALYNNRDTNDTITINQQSDYTYITVNGITKNFLTSSFDTLSVLSRTAVTWDVINVEATVAGAGRLLVINGGSGSNRVYLSPGAKNLSQIQGNINVFESDMGNPGVFGTTDLFFNDQNFDQGRNFNVSSTGVRFSGSSALIRYSGYSNSANNIKSLELRGGASPTSATTFWWPTETPRKPTPESVPAAATTLSASRP